MVAFRSGTKEREAEIQACFLIRLFLDLVVTATEAGAKKRNGSLTLARSTYRQAPERFSLIWQ